MKLISETLKFKLMPKHLKFKILGDKYEFLADQVRDNLEIESSGQPVC